MSDPATSEVSAIAELSARVRAAFPALDFDQAGLIVHGEDNLVLVLDGTWVVRFPRNEEYRARFAAELNLLRILRPISSLPVPDYEFVAPDGNFGAYRRLAGREMTPDVFRAMTAQHRDVILPSLASFLSVLHALPVQTIAQANGMVARTWSGSQFAALYRGMRRAKIAPAVPGELLVRFDAFHDAFETLSPGTARLVHDDLSDDHILIDEAGTRISGIIDFSDASYGDPAIDLSFFWRLGEGSVDRVLQGYRFASEDREIKTRSRWTYVRYMINQLAHGHQAKWRQNVNETLAELQPHLTALGF